MENKPVKVVRQGAIAASIWLRKGTNGVYYEFTLSRSFKAGDESGYSQSFRERNDDALVQVVRDAAAWIRDTMENAETVTILGDAA